MEEPVLNAHNKEEFPPTDEQVTAIGSHVRNTSEIGTFRIISHDFNDGVWRLRWKTVQV